MAGARGKDEAAGRQPARGGSPTRALVVLLVVLLPLAAAEPVAVEPTGDAQADGVAVSGTGDAHSTCRAFGTIPCASVSVLGNATGGANRVEVVHMRACVTDGFGRPLCFVDGGADLGVVVFSASGDAHGGIALAPQGHASGGLLSVGASSQGVVALATGDAAGTVALGGGDARGFVAVAIFGEGQAEGCLTTPVDPCHEGAAVSLLP